MRTWIISSLLAVTTALPLHAFEQPSLQLFATCAGRLSAEMEFAWLMHSERADVVEQQRADVLDLLAAVMEAGQERQALATRIAAKQAHAALLTRATLNEDDEDAAWAASLAQRQHANCLAFLLS